jgi:hypothetical protein
LAFSRFIHKGVFILKERFVKERNIRKAGDRKVSRRVGTKERRNERVT